MEAQHHRSDYKDAKYTKQLGRQPMNANLIVAAVASVIAVAAGWHSWQAGSSGIPCLSTDGDGPNMVCAAFSVKKMLS
jgi:hypothetical protein